MAELELAALASRQHSLVTRRQARDHLSREQLRHRLATGRLEPYRWGVCRYPGSSEVQWQPLMGACLAGGPGAVASHRSAAVLWEMSSVVSDQPEITVPWPQWPRLPGVKSHQSTLLPAEHCAVRSGVPVTTAARTLADLSSVLPPEFLRRVIEGCLRRRLLVVPDLRAVHATLARRGRHGLDGLAQALSRYDGLFDPGGSGAELDLLDILVAAGLPRPAQQHQVVIGGVVYVLDYAYPDLWVGMEYDGFAYHRLPTDLDRAAARNNALELAGWRMLHFTAASGPARIVADVTAARERSLRANGVHDPHLRDIEVGS
ncbi:MAG: hypothetical protein ACRD2W_08720 [Acidimicrobiales bacterium]